MRAAVSVAAAALALTACSSHVARTSMLTGDGRGSGGVSYYLPMRYALVSFDRARADSKAAEALAKAKEAKKEAEAKLKAAEAGAAAQAKLLETLDKEGFAKTSETFKAAQAELVKRRLEVVSLTAELATQATKEAQATQALADFNNADAMCGWVDAIKVELQAPVPDTTARYQLNLEDSPFRHDILKIGTTPSGLLKTMDAALDDQTSEIIVSLAQSIATTGSGMRKASHGLMRVDSPRAPAGCDKLAWRPLSLKLLVDPASTIDWSKASTSIRAAAEVTGINGGADRDFNYSLGLDAPPPIVNPPRLGRTPERVVSKRTRDDRAHRGESGRTNGIFYRRERPLLVSVELEGTPVGAFALVVPNGAPVDSAHVIATTFATNTSKVGFENGMLVSLDTDRPSPVLEVVSLPWKIARATLGIINEIFQLRVNHATSQAALVEQQVALIEQMEALIEAERALEVTRDGSGLPDPVLSPPPGE